jgi:hypothetical protein
MVYRAKNTNRRPLVSINQLLNSDKTFMNYKVRIFCVFNKPFIRIGVTSEDKLQPIPILKQIDLWRNEFVSALFKGIRFTGNDLKMRVRSFLVFYNLEMTLFPNQNMDDRMKFLELRYSWLTDVNK